MPKKSSPCPACGGTVEFRSAMSLVSVCPYCHSAIARQDRQLTDLGKVAEIADSESPLQLGLRGVWNGKSFRLIGRVQYRHFAGGTWDEWYVQMAGNKWGWLSEAQGRFGILQARPVKDPSQIPKYESLAAGEKVSLGAAGEFTVAEAGTAIVVGAEGELPFSPTLEATHQFVDLEAPGGQLATIEYGESPQIFIGESATLLELGLASAALKEATTQTVGGAQLNCPKCAGPLELVAPDDAQRVTCPNCRALLDIAGNKLEYLSTLKPPNPPLKIPLGTKGTLRGVEYRVIGYVRRSVKYDKNYYWQEYLLYAPRHGYRWLIDSDDHWSFGSPVPIGSIDRSYPTAAYDSRTYKIFQKTTATVRQVWGEFYWKVKVDESVLMEDYVSPPFSLTLEISGAADDAGRPSEINATRSEYLPHEEIEAAFGVKNLPRGWGVAPNQPNPVTGLLYSQWIAFLAAIAVIYVILPWITGRSVDFALTLWAAGLMSAIPLGSLAYAYSFEGRRWQDSEFNPYDTGGGDDDDE